MRSDCRRITVDASAAGTWRATPGMGRGGNPCVGPTADYTDLQARDGDVITYLNAATDKTGIIYTSATSGRVYEVYASGRWQQDSTDDKYMCGPTGTGTLIVDAGQAFDGISYGRFCIKEPGSSSWVGADSFYTVRATASGNILGSFADNLGAWGNNAGYMTILVRPL